MRSSSVDAALRATHARAVAPRMFGGMDGWEAASPGVLRLPSGRLIRGRGLSRDEVGVAPEFGLYLLDRSPPPVAWSWRWLPWPDWQLPEDHDDAADALQELWVRARSERVEVACSGGLGRTGTALACLAVLDGVAAGDAVAFVREHYHPRAVETANQRRFVRGFSR